eukprot:3909529-Prymnesium_polylepis.1
MQRRAVVAFLLQPEQRWMFEMEPRWALCFKPAVRAGRCSGGYAPSFDQFVEQRVNARTTSAQRRPARAPAGRANPADRRRLHDMAAP